MDMATVTILLSLNVLSKVFSPTSLLKNTHVKNCVNVSDEKGKHSAIFSWEFKFTLLKC